jgi:hypothetical protein
VKRSCLLLCFIAFSFLASAQDWKGNAFITPGVTAGFTFGAGMSYGVTLDMGMRKDDFKYGLAFSYSFVHTQKYIHRLRSACVFGSYSFVQLKAGTGLAKNFWGKKNRCKVRGFAWDMSFNHPDFPYAYAGYRSFLYYASGWAWFDGPYRSLYGGFRVPVYPFSPDKVVPLP